MSILDRVVAAVTPLESDEDRATARHNARQMATSADWLSMVLDHHEAIEAAFEHARSATPGNKPAAVKALAIVLA